MDHKKKSLEINGRPIFPIEAGTSAFISEPDGMRRTSTVLRVEKISSGEIFFETRNTLYRLHLEKQEVPV